MSNAIFQPSIHHRHLANIRVVPFLDLLPDSPSTVYSQVSVDLLFHFGDLVFIFQPGHLADEFRVRHGNGLRISFVVRLTTIVQVRTERAGGHTTVYTTWRSWVATEVGSRGTLSSIIGSERTFFGLHDTLAFLHFTLFVPFS
ncbi:hypothetical protein BC826DRAFT_384877 [Russula brevipes]|nr:hypothetical protein BC826DRAFT_384877 [Russula brevipes]